MVDWNGTNTIQKHWDKSKVKRIESPRLRKVKSHFHQDLPIFLYAFLEFVLVEIMTPSKHTAS